MKRDELKDLVEPAVTGLGYEFVGLELIRGGGVVLRVYIDGPAGVTVDDCASVSHELSAVLDVHDPIKSAYTLEVSSPGLDRPLFTAEHFRRFAGHRAKITLDVPLEGRRKFDGAIIGMEDDESLRFEQDGQEVRIALADIRKANLVYEF